MVLVDAQGGAPLYEIINSEAEVTTFECFVRAVNLTLLGGFLSRLIHPAIPHLKIRLLVPQYSVWSEANPGI